MGNQSQQFLFLDIGSAVSKGYLFDHDSTRVSLLNRCECPTLRGTGWIEKNLTSLLEREDGVAEQVTAVSALVQEVDPGEAGKGRVLVGEELWLGAEEFFSGDFLKALVLEVGAGKSWKVGLGRTSRAEVTAFELGLGTGAVNLLNSLSSEMQLTRWVSQQAPTEEVVDYVGNKSIYPAQLPFNSFALEMELAMAREILPRLVEGCRIGVEQPKVILQGQVFGRVSNSGLSLLAFLDGVQPEGMVQVLLDEYSLIPFLSKQDWKIEPWLKSLGTVVTFTHVLDYGRPLGRVFLDLGLREDLEVILRAGDFVRVPLEKSSAGKLRLELAAGVDVVEFDPEQSVSGGEVGLVLDARGRPLPQLKTDPESRLRLRQWQAALE